MSDLTPSNNTPGIDGMPLPKSRRGYVHEFSQSLENYVAIKQLEAKICLLSEMLSNECYTSGAKRVDYVPAFRIKDSIANMEVRLDELKGEAK